MYYLIHGAINGVPDIVHLLKTQRFSFSCLQNPDRLNDLEVNFKGASQGTIINRPKNLKNIGGCSADTAGVNLKFNFASDDISNSCSPWFRGLSAQSEPETKALVSYISKTSSSLGLIILLGNGQYSIDYPSKFYNSSDHGDKNLKSRLSTYLSRFLNDTGVTAAYSIDKPSSQASGPNYILNNLATSRNITTIGLDTFNVSVGGTYFIPSTDLSTVARLTNSLLLRSACLQEYCPDLLFESFFCNLCQQKVFISLCESIKTVDSNKIYGLNFSVSNFGQVGKLSETFVLTLPSSYQLVSLYSVGAAVPLTFAGPDGRESWTQGELKNLPFDDLGENFVYHYKKYRITLNPMLPSSRFELMAMVQTDTVGDGAAFLGISGYENIARDLSITTTKLSSIFVNLKPEEIEKPTVVEVKVKTINFEIRKVSFVILFIYLSFAFLWGLGWAVHLVFGGSPIQSLNSATGTPQQ